MRSCCSRASSGLCTTPDAMSCACVTIRVANDTPGTTITNSAVTMTSAAAARAFTCFSSHRCSGSNTTYSTGIASRPLANGTSATTNARPSNPIMKAARW